MLGSALALGLPTRDDMLTFILVFGGIAAAHATIMGFWLLPWLHERDVRRAETERA